jgi:hypothetical protein
MRKVNSMESTETPVEETPMTHPAFIEKHGLSISSMPTFPKYEPDSTREGRFHVFHQFQVKISSTSGSGAVFEYMKGDAHRWLPPLILPSLHGVAGPKGIGGRFEFFNEFGKRIRARSYNGPFPSFHGDEKIRLWPRHTKLDHERLYELSKVIPPQLDEVLDCLAMDSQCREQTFEDWASDFGYDTDSIKAEKTWRACQENAAKLLHLLGQEGFDELMGIERL